jgi:membrane peptidoglycan carboxypeptidase
MADRQSVLGESPSLYAPDQLALTQDYRVLVGIRYVIDLARRSGVRSKLEPVQSLVLGSSDITLLEVAQLYQVMFTGNTYQFFPSAEGALASGQDAAVDQETLETPFDARRASGLPVAGLISRIERADGELIYEAVRDTLSVQDPQTAGEMGTMLRQVVRHGTGRRAAGAVRATSGQEHRQERLAALPAWIPLAGKTGTTNAYRNAAFVGMVPGLPEGREDLTWGSGQVVAVYVGYDDNTEMKRGGIRIAGSSGGLPVWVDVAKACVEASDTGDRVDLVDLALSTRRELVLRFPEGFEEIPIDLTTGLPLELSIEEAEASEGTGLISVLPGEGRFTPFHPLPYRADGP